MSTAQTLIDRAAKWINVLSSGNSLTTNEYADALIELNGILDDWNNERLMCFAQQDETFNTIASQSVYTIGPSGAALVTTRPVTIEEAWIIASNITYPVRLIDNEEYDAIPFKTSSSNWPDRANYTPTFPNGTITMYPIPNGTYAFHMRTRIQLTAFAATSTTVSLPPGWESALSSELCIRIAPQFEKSAPVEIAKLAANSKRRLEIVNSKPVRVENEIASAFRRGRSRIISDT